MTSIKQRQLFSIIAAPLVEWLRAQNFPMPQPPIRFYPDGSLWTNEYSVLQWTRETVIAGRNHRQDLTVEMLIHDKLLGGCGNCSFRSLAPFGGDWSVAPHYRLLYPGSCDWIGEQENWALTYPGILRDATDEEYDLSRVRVLVKLRRKFTAGLAEELAAELRRWFAQVGSKGVFGEAGLGSISPAMCYSDRCAAFELDARGSGQETLNTLYLAVLNWAMNFRRPLVLTDLAADPTELVLSSDQSVALR